ncbi:hypothetical protein LUZ61_007974 [Rhynchospora tenuis]|uniref:polynucleotide adenylyltransferase n=1 Tax=Rhynchospora tenuis TaxID=198213 RepID=A0AAD5ZUF8_9POAL|nr:hypothetical protein LUZ61_007974 [Rhynchospora tenuis]
MEQQQDQPSIAYSYDTLAPLSLSSVILYDSLPSLTPSASHIPDPPAPYAVFRNQITDVAGESTEVPSTDFFSLDVVAATPAPDTDDPAALNSALDEPECSEKAWFRVGRRFKSPMLQLHKEILDFCDFVAPTPEEEESRTVAVQRVSDVIKHIWPDCKVEVFGSFRTGLYLPNSDIDIVILESQVKSPQIGLKALAKALTQQNIASKMQVIAKARVPIVKFVERNSKIAFDISFDLDGGPKAADFIKNAVRQLPPLRPLSLILKVFLQQRELNEVFSGGIGSYALLTMLIAYLQIHWRGQESQAHGQQKEQNLGILLVSFFDFFGRKLNNSDVGVSCNSSSNFYSKSDKGFVNNENQHLLSIQDPQAADNDIAKNSYNYYKVKMAFSLAFSILSDPTTIINLGPNRSILGTIIRPDNILLNRKGGRSGDVPFDSFLAGAGEPLDPAFDKHGDIIYNWQLMEDEPLPRDNLVTLDNNLLSSQKKKKRFHSKSKERYPESGGGGSASSSRERVKKRGILFRDEEEKYWRRKKSRDFDRSC